MDKIHSPPILRVQALSDRCDNSNFRIAPHDANTSGILLVQRSIVRYTFQIFLWVPIENQISIANRVVINQVVQC